MTLATTAGPPAGGPRRARRARSRPPPAQADARIGQLLVQSATAKDLPMLQGVAMLVAAVIIVANLLADVAYILVDPRVRLGRGTS